MAPGERAAQFARRYLVALQFFTRLPVTGAMADWVGWSPDKLRASAAHFPGVGWIVGLAACAAFALVHFLLPATPFTPLLAAVAATACTVLLTGAFHEDGLADTADGLGGSAGRDRALAIMKDSRIGAYGAVALVLALLGKTAVLAVLATAAPPSVYAALLAGHTVSRFWPLLIVRTLSYVADEDGSKSKPLADRIEPGALAVAAAWCAVPLAIAALVQGPAFVIAAVLGSGAACWGMRRWLRRRLGGFTGDTLGATQQACEIAFYLGAALALSGPR
jgi:adenosylcobinamide-GDP ribazoletransferase